MSTWWDQRLRGCWEHYQQSLAGKTLSPAQQGEPWKGRLDYHRGLEKAESSAAIQLRTEKIGLNHFLFTRKVPGVLDPGCPCGARKQTGKHVLLFCPDYQEGRIDLIREAGTSDYNQILSTPQGIRLAARQFVRMGALPQFSVANEQMRRSDAKRAAEAANNDVGG